MRSRRSRDRVKFDSAVYIEIGSDDKRAGSDRIRSSFPLPSITSNNKRGHARERHRISRNCGPRERSVTISGQFEIRDELESLEKLHARGDLNSQA